MGRKTWESLPPKFRPLPGRLNIVVTRQTDWQAEGARRAASLPEALTLCPPDSNAWVIGGAEIYAQALPLAHTAVVTEIDADFEGDAFAPQFGPAGWKPPASATPRPRGWASASSPTRTTHFTPRKIDMSGHGFHVHGPHDHELEHAQQGGHGGEHGGMINQIALFTAVIATVGAIFGYMGGATQANAGLYKNNAAIKKTEASNQWNYFQSKSTKQSLAELARDLAAGEPEKAKYQAKVDRYEKEKNEIKIVADKLEADASAWDKQSDEQMHQHHRWAQSTTVLQVSIAMAAIALLTKKKWLELAMFVAGGAGLGRRRVGSAAHLSLRFGSRSRLRKVPWCARRAFDIGSVCAGLFGGSRTALVGVRAN